MKRCSVLSAFLVTLFCFAAFAQTPPAQQLPARQLDDLVAPLALYPDSLLGQMLAASTYPVELVEAEQWLDANHQLTGQPMMDAARQQNWDPSVQALLAVPYALTTLTQDIHWTTDLGNAFLAQQSDVMNAVQRMRSRAQANGRLQSTPQETVTMQDQNSQNAIAIDPVNPQEMYVPAYDPEYVWGAGAYPPLYYPSGYWFEPGIDLGFWFPGWGFGLGWGWGLNWFGHGLFVNTGFFNRFGYGHGFGFGGGAPGRLAWAHDPGHRMGAGYPGGSVNARFGPASTASRMEAGRSGNWHSFGEGNIGATNSAARSSFAAGANRMSAQPASRGFTPQSQSRFQSTPQRFQSAPAQRMQSAPQMRAPSGPQRSAAPATHSFGGGGGSVSHGSGSSHASASHGGGRR